MRRFVILMLLGVAAGAGPMAAAQTGSATGELARLQGEYRDEAVRARRLRAEARVAADELAALERRLRSLSDAAGQDEAQVRAQRMRLEELNAREARLTAGLARERATHGRLLSALQLMSRRPPPPLLVPADRALDTVRASILIRATTPTLEARAQALDARMTEAGRVRRLAILSSERLLTLESDHQDRRAEIEALGARQRSLSAVLDAEARRSERAARILETRIRALGGAAVAPVDADVADAARLPAGRLRLSSPLAGPPARRFEAEAPGWRWRADRATVAAPAAGRVAYAGGLAGWGGVVILDLGPGWRVVLAGLDALGVETGQAVTEGQALGETGADGEAYLELRRDDRPVDPAPWLS